MDHGKNCPTLADLVDQHYALLYRYAYRLTGSELDAEDLTQQAFLTAQVNLGQLREPDRSKSWLCTILRNTYLKGLKQSGPKAIHSLEHVPEPSDPLSGEPGGSTSSPSDSLFDLEQLQQALNELPEEYRSPIILFYFGEFSYKEIADQMGVPIGTVMSRLARAKSHLKKRLTGCATSA